MTFEDYAALLSARFSCRGFLDRPVSRQEISAVLAAAQQVPSWCNSQPWQVTACGPSETASLRADLLAHAAEEVPESDIPFPERYDGPYAERRRACGWQLYDAVGVEKGDRAGSARQMMENFRLFGAPNFLLVTTPKALGPYGVLDCGAFVTAILLGLQARGLGGIAMASVAGYAGFFRTRFDIGAERDVLCGIALGHPDPEHPANGFRTTRAAEAEIVIWRD